MVNSANISALLSLFGSKPGATQNKNHDSGISFSDSLNSLIGMGDSSSANAAPDLFGSSDTGMSSSDFLSLFGTQAPATDGSATFAEDELNHGGPLPAFLTAIEAQLGLTKDQDTSLEQIAVKFLDAPGEPSESDVADALKSAGLPA